MSIIGDTSGSYVEDIPDSDGFGALMWKLSPIRERGSRLRHTDHLAL